MVALMRGRPMIKSCVVYLSAQKKQNKTKNPPWWAICLWFKWNFQVVYNPQGSRVSLPVTEQKIWTWLLWWKSYKPAVLNTMARDCTCSVRLLYGTCSVIAKIMLRPTNHRQDHTYFCPYRPVATKQPSHRCWENKPHNFCLLTIPMSHVCREVHHDEWAVGRSYSPSSMFMCFIAHVLDIGYYFLKALHNILFRQFLMTLTCANPGDDKLYYPYYFVIIYMLF